MYINTKNFILENKIITICRRIYGDKLLKLVEALHKGGINLVEVTFDQSDSQCMEKTAEAIRSLCEHFGKGMMIGAGTVIMPEQVIAAKDAGAGYIISPNVDEKVIMLTKQLGLVSIPGAMTPTEITSAHNLGADIVKVFPAGYLGLKYIKDVRAPLSHIHLVAAGGVTEENVLEYHNAGYSCFGVSGRLTDAKVIDAGDYTEFTRRAQAFVNACR
ncbi:bifunctional 4-hydroxy-2-oxoglutarate aldolase/2-dehydro-3-deoxy-phosphogluconate aldolase [Geosporobacter ferrireducens]|uniref:2-dehydro-3-deoxyphosphogluconate aldolase n=1 Tax=Geosporobacter ferrireducens TaxID=1424294 RepID=A0A1D8GFG7_9FIRM|nr:bifunctional 4-hydroxy-2-oxoglutarate aldolase/2-dehydro-3-deoxy-phosphogluconate aldolase [Geosporobacter ferrireducens]AOT69647.1 2-dehydro-3-deoxyphosphogluconate aldolase [Geosporobacter ferrireducens]MTI54648.1 bifunctional 4-hydroxy-2-oxoglutarate aldolase/2-dehydro-3-deoxy-phosphogluconate aldolase [Geosporobacter ferrireducens]